MCAGCIESKAITTCVPRCVPYPTDAADGALDGQQQQQHVHLLRFVRGNKGNPKMLYNGYAYFKNNARDAKTYWLCARNRSQKCKARIITLDGSRELVLKNQWHNHEQEPVVPTAAAHRMAAVCDADDTVVYTVAVAGS